MENFYVVVLEQASKQITSVHRRLRLVLKMLNENSIQFFIHLLKLDCGEGR